MAMEMKINPRLEDFLKKAKKYNLIVFSHKFYCDFLTPTSIYSNISRASKGESFLLESVEGEEKISRYSFIGCDPLCVVRTKDRNCFITFKGKTRRETITNDPLHSVRSVMREFKVWPKENIRFFGGFVGYLGYDCVRFFEPIGKRARKVVHTDDSYFVLSKYLIIFDHRKKQIEILSFLPLETQGNLNSIYRKEVKNFKKLIEKILKPFTIEELTFDKRKKLKLKSNFTKVKFTQAVRKIKHYIKEGEIIQAVLSQRFSTPFSGDPFLVYRYLRLLNPSPYMFYLNFKKVQVVGSSPEMLTRCEHGIVTTRPIAGTRPRGKSVEEDRALEKDLLNDAKERAEHLMLVDLGRNDLGRVAQSASVHVPLFMNIEQFSHVMHIVSEVEAKLSKRCDVFDALRACFPAGTVSGAPKVRAMQIINELEPDERGIYAGCVGYFSFTNSLDMCIIIRTIVFKEGKAYIQAGAGIVSDSQPLREFRETVNKAKAQVVALELAKKEA